MPDWGVKLMANGDLESPFRALESVNFWGLAASVQTKIDWIFSVFEQRSVNVGHVTAVGPAENSASGENTGGRLVPAKHEVHAADQVDEEIAGEAGAVFLPAAPTSENFGVKRTLGHRALPGLPVNGLGAGVGRRRIFPSAARIIAAERAFDEI